MKKFGFLALMLAVLVFAVPMLAEVANDPVVVKVGDTVVTLSAVQAEFDAQYEESVRFLQEYGTPMTEDLMLMLRDDVINQLVQMAVMDNKVVEYGLGDITEEEKAEAADEAERMLTESILGFAEQMGITVEEAQAEYEKYGFTVEAQRAMMIENLPYVRLYDKIIEGIEVTDESVMEEYNATVEYDRELYGEDVGSYELFTSIYGKETYYMPEGYRLVKRVVLEMPAEIAAQLTDFNAELIALQDDIDALSQELFAAENPESAADGAKTERTVDEINADIDTKTAEHEALELEYKALSEKAIPDLQSTIDEINGKLAAGESFDAIIAEYSNDSQLEASPDGYEVHAESIVYDEPFREGAMALQNKGDVSEPILGEYGVYIIQYVDDVAGGALPITEEIKAELRQNILATNQETVYAQMIDEWMNEEAIETHPELIVLPELPTEQPGDLEEGEESVG